MPTVGLVGLVGLGKIGLPIAENLIKGGYRRSSMADFERVGGVAWGDRCASRHRADLPTVGGSAQ